MSAALAPSGLGHRYGKHHWGLQDCSLTIEAGSVVALIGPNGSGKTTLLNMAAGLLQPTTGKVEVHGEPPGQQLDRIGYVAQDAPLDLSAHPLRPTAFVLMGKYLGVTDGLRALYPDAVVSEEKLDGEVLYRLVRVDRSRSS